MDAAELWSLGDYGVVGDLWSAPGRDLVASLDVRGLDVVDLATGTGVTALALARAPVRAPSSGSTSPRPCCGRRGVGPGRPG